MARAEAKELLDESRAAIDVLTKLVARLEVYTDRVESELDRREQADGGDHDRRSAS